jgi:hypothetical protein
MTPFKINPKSWHFRAANWFNSNNYLYRGGLPDDFCTYARNVLWGILAIGVICACCIGAILGGLFMVSQFAIWAYNSIVAGQLLAMNGPAGVTSGLLVCALILGAIRALAVWYHNWERRPIQTAWEKLVKSEEPGFIMTWLQTTKGKFCLPIVMKDD